MCMGIIQTLYIYGSIHSQKLFFQIQIIQKWPILKFLGFPQSNHILYRKAVSSHCYLVCHVLFLSLTCLI